MVFIALTVLCILIFSVSTMCIFYDKRSIRRVKNVKDHYRTLCEALSIDPKEKVIVPDIRLGPFILGNIMLAAVCVASVPTSVITLSYGFVYTEVLQFSGIGVLLYGFHFWMMKKILYSRLIVSGNIIYWTEDASGSAWDSEYISKVSDASWFFGRGLCALKICFTDRKSIKFFGVANGMDITQRLLSR